MWFCLLAVLSLLVPAPLPSLPLLPSYVLVNFVPSAWSFVRWLRWLYHVFKQYDALLVVARSSPPSGETSCFSNSKPYIRSSGDTDTNRGQEGSSPEDGSPVISCSCG